MAQLGLNITDGRVECGATGEGKDGSAGSDVEIWAVAAVHACTNHACTPPPTRRSSNGGGGGGPNVRPDFVSTPGVGLTHRAIAIRRIAPGEELTCKAVCLCPLLHSATALNVHPIHHTVLVCTTSISWELKSLNTQYTTVCVQRHVHIHTALMLVYIHSAWLLSAPCSLTRFAPHSSLLILRSLFSPLQ